MTVERFKEDLLAHKWLEGGTSTDKEGRSYVLYECGASFLFLIEDKIVTDSLYGGWNVPVEKIRVTRHRYQSFEIETVDGESFGFELDDGEIEVGCQG
ncbi:MAG: hypothetical protein KBS81_00655 [Spirochaetales bacterium]|nr:hypothetical protein [Candidatus Physcosoma equi]